MVLPFVRGHRANMVPIYDEVGTDSELTEQAERLAGWRLRQAHILQAWAQETQKLSIQGVNCMAVWGREADNSAHKTLMYCVVWTPGCQHMHEPELPLTAPMDSSVTNPAPEAIVA